MKRNMLLTAIALTVTSLSWATVYVDKDSAGTPDGNSWATAFHSIQQGINKAFSAGGGEVWVSAGVYDELRYESSGSLALAENVHVFGGFLGTESALTERNWVANVTTIDGSTSRGGSPAYHVVLGAENATIDGFTITGGMAVDEQNTGGGMLNQGVSPHIANCIFTGNSAQSSTSPYPGGGAINNAYCAPVIERCIFETNTTTYAGGGMNNFFASPVITNCIFKGNTGPLGGAMCATNSSISLTNCVFVSNQAGEGGAIYGNNNSHLVIVNSTFYGNESTNARGGVAYMQLGANFDAVNCILWGDIPNELFLFNGGIATLSYCDIQGGYTGTENISADPLFVLAPNNVHLQSGSPCKDTGTATGAPATDIEGILRPQGAGYDMGAYEYIVEAEGEGGSEGEGGVEGGVEGQAEGVEEGVIEGQAEGAGEGDIEGIAEGQVEGEGEGILTVQISGANPVTAQVGHDHTFETVVHGQTGTVHYQWFVDNSQKTFTPISHTDVAALTICNVAFGNTGLYYCHVTDDITEADSNTVQLIVVAKTPAASIIGLIILVMIVAGVGGMRVRIKRAKH